MKKIFCLFFLITIYNATFSQKEGDVSFHKITGPNGESLGKINAIAQDHRGYLWFAANSQRGLYRYDGVRLKLYRRDIFDDNSLGGATVETLFVDSKGIVWIAVDGQLDRFDPVTEKFTHYVHDPKNPSSLSPGVSVIYEDRKGRCAA